MNADLFPKTREPEILFPAAKTSCLQITSVDEYRSDDIRAGDRVLDIGANVGAFCIRAAKTVARVTAVEPVTVPLLRGNSRINKVAVRFVAGGPGEGKLREICCDGCRVVCPTYTLRDLISLAGGCDYLKCDCEGAEWLISPPGAAPVRRIGMEIHIPPVTGPLNRALPGYIGHWYDFAIERKPCHEVYGVMGILHAKRKYL